MTAKAKKAGQPTAGAGIAPRCPPLMHFDEAAPQMAVAVAVAEIDREPDHAPDRQDQDGCHRKEEIEPEAADHRQRPDQP